MISQQELIESDKRFRALLSATSDVIYQMSADWNMLAQLQGRGFLQDTSEPIPNWMDKYLPEAERARVLTAARQAIANKSVFELEHQVLQLDGSLGWTFSRAIPILDDAGEIKEWFGAASDITARKNIEAALQAAKDESDRQKRLLEAISGSTPDLVYIFDLEYRFVYVNRALLIMWGRSIEDSVGKRLLEVGYEPWHAAMHEREIDRVAATKQAIRGEVSFPHAELGRRIYDYIFAPVFNDKGEVELVAGTTRDISDLKRAEDLLKQSEEQFRSLTQSLPQLIFTANTDGYCDFFNEQWYEFTGSDAEHSCGDGWAQYIHKDFRADLFALWQDCLRTGNPIVYEFQLRAREGHCQWFYVLGKPILADTGVIKKWVGALTNIESHKASQDKLEKMVLDRTQELQRSNEDLQQFAHVASHDLKEPLRKIQIFAGRLLDDKDSTISESGLSYLQKINAASKRMSAMIEGVLSFSSMAATQAPLETVDLNAIVNDIALELEVALQQTQATITCGPLPQVEGAGVLLHQLLYNLLTNSLKFVRKDVAPVITIMGAQVVRSGVAMAEIILTDNGIGFDPRHAASIFQTFTRLNSKDEYEGTGLGLALCKKIVERHHGAIEATGALHVGATFRLYLPIRQPAGMI